jgi:hypothetical protein
VLLVKENKMPVSIKKEDGGYQVSTPNQVHAKHTTLKKAKAQERLLNAVEHGWKPTGKKAKHHSANDGSFLMSRAAKFGCMGKCGGKRK